MNINTEKKMKISNKMKKFAQYVLVLAVITISAYSIYQINLNPCDKPLKYKIGRFDAQFGIPEEQFKSYIAEAEQIWEKALGKDMFIYDSRADFDINLIYDQRQLSTVQKQKTEFGLSSVEDIFKKLDAKFSLFKTQYDQKVSLYEQSLTSFKDRKSAYETEVILWNNKGGAPKNEYESLETEKRNLNVEAERLNIEAVSINKMTEQLKVLLKGRNTKALEYNKITEDYNKKYGHGLEFDQAEYVVNQQNNKESKINVYQFGNRRDLVLALTHELGHALGMNHVENPKSIMYYSTGANTEVLFTPSIEDLAELKRVCKM